MDKKFGVQSDTGGSLSGLIGFEKQFGYDKVDGWKVEQDVTPFIEQAAAGRGLHNKKTHFRKFATIPDVIAIEVYQKYDINIHDPDTITDKALMTKFKSIIVADYPWLVENT